MTLATKVLLTLSVIAAIWWAYFILIESHNHSVMVSFDENRAKSAQFERETKETIQRLNRRETTNENHERNSR